MECVLPAKPSQCHKSACYCFDLPNCDILARFLCDCAFEIKKVQKKKKRKDHEQQPSYPIKLFYTSYAPIFMLSAYALAFQFFSQLVEFNDGKLLLGVKFCNCFNKFLLDLSSIYT